MARYCPLTNTRVVYLDCLECENKVCEKRESSEDKKEEKSGN